MLILTRKTEQSIIIVQDPLVEIKVLGIRGNQVKIGVITDRDVTVLRNEIYERSKGEGVENG